MAWTNEQLDAIYKRDTNIIVSAGAGSGKTAVLSERILEYCKNGGDIRRVLVLTFTNAAASEMKERIRKKLLANKLYKQADYIDSAYITTFDAYSLALVKKYYYKLDLSKNIGIMDGALIAIKRKKIIEELFSELYNNEDQAFFSFLRKYSKQDDKDIIKIVDELCSKFELIIDYDNFIKTYDEKYYSDEKLNHIVDEYELYAKEEVYEFILKLNDLLEASQTDTASSKLHDDLLVISEKLNDINSYEGYYELFNTISLPRLSPKSCETVKEVKKSLDESFKSLKANVFSKYMFKEDMLNELKLIHNDILFLLNICNEVLTRLFSYKKSIMQFDYTDIAKLAIKLVTEYDDVKNELKYFYNEILVDEYQDTSDIQEAFLSQIENNNLYMVGDIKQSIYRFRNANPYIFKSKYDSYAKNINGYKIDLSFNFRSRCEVLDNINTLFNKLMTESCGDANYIIDHQMNYGLKAYESLSQDFDYNLDIFKYSKDEYQDYNDDEIEAFIAAKEIKNILDKKPKVFKNGEYKEANYNDFAILIDKAKSFVTFKRVFEHLNIPLSIEADLDLKDSILPKLFSNILLLIYKTRNNIFDTEYKHSLAALARSFIYEYDDEDIFKLIVLNEKYPILDDIKELSFDNEESLEEMFYKISFKLEIYEKLALIGDVDNSLVVLEYIYKMFNMFQQTQMEICDAVDYLSTIFETEVKLSYKLQSNSNESVRIMTIHKSKGLEFPFCIFPLLSSSFNKADVRATTGFSSEYGIYIPYADEGKSNTIIKTLIANQITKADISERVRLLYVALTRAREKMILIMNDKEYPNLTPKKFTSFHQMVTYYNVFNDYIKEIDLNDYNITLDYKKKKESTNSILDGIALSYDILKEPKLIENVRISKSLKELPSKDVKDSIKLGLEFHAALEAIDFNNPDIENLPATPFVKNVISNILDNEIFKNINKAKALHEYEFYYENDLKEYHGIIDLLVIYDDRIDIIDYKLSNVDSSEYIRQLGIYKEYIQSRTNKPINVYLLSILKSEIKKLDI